ncbi:TPA: phage tail tape measure protein [Bacillus paranthracis]|nr:tail protein [Bacillus cereus]MDR4351338.1 phage tail tape measure protein [Bacillus paranthracis]TKC26182.1 phage tail tape measure protein [Bacillus paranthracis]HDR7458551.1 phage tail tape measure protein [Bacillus paranthracis]HDR7475330.1 phage tail tape measure protein [Bacillus paranthracis]
MDLRNFDSGVAGMNRKLKMVDSEFKAASEEAKRYGDSVSQLRTKMDYLTQKLDIQKQKVSHFSQEIEKLRNKQQQLRTSSENLAGKMQRLEREYKQSAQATGKNSEQTKRLKQELDSVKAQYTANIQSLSRVNAAIEKNATNLNRAREAEARLKNQIHQTNEALERQTSLFHRAGERMRSIGTRMQDVGATMGASFMAGATTMGYALGKTITTAADFESAMSRVAALSGASDAELQKLTQTARELGASTSFSASQAAEGMQYLAMAGFKTNDVIAAMPGLLDLAASGQMDLGAAADITSNIMSGFGIAAQDAGRVADVLAKASTNANTDVAQLGEAMVYLAPVSKSLGWSLEEATAAVMAMSDAGIQGAQAGAAFSTSMGRLAKPTGEMEKTMKKLKIEIFDANGKMKSMPGVIKELEKATRGMTDQQKSATLTTIFGAEAYKHWAVLIDKSSDALASNTEMLKKSAGTAKEIAAKQLDNLKGKLVILQSSIEGASITIGHALIPAIDAIASGVQSAVDWFNNLDEGTQQMIATGAALTVGIMGVVGVLGLMSMAIGALLANPVVIAIAAATGAVAGLSLAVIKLMEDTKKADNDARNFGDGVSEGTKKAASGYVKMRDQALVALNDLAFSTGEKAKEAVQKAHEEFAKLTDEAMKALEKDKAKFNNFMGKFFGDAADEGTKKLSERIRAKAGEYYAQQEEAIRNADKTMHDLINKYGNNLFDMSEKDFRRYTAAWQAFDKSTATSVSKSIGELKKVNDAFNKIDKGVSLEQAQKHVVELTNSTTKSLSEISKARDKDVDNAKKYAKQIGLQGQEETAFIDQVKRKYGEQEVAVRENYFTKMNKIRDVLGAKQSELDFEGQMTKAEKDRFDAFLVGTGSASAGFEDLYDKNNKFFDKLKNNFDKSVTDWTKYEESVKRFGDALPESLNKFYDTLKSGGEKAKIATELIAIEMENGVKAVDLGPAGKVKVDEFIAGVQNGTYNIEHVAIATINQMRDTFGQQSLTQEGIDTMKSYVDGLRETDNVKEIAKNLKLDLQSETKIDLGPYGQHTAKTFAEGLKDGSMGIDSVYIYFQQKLKGVTQVDLNKEGRQTIATLKTGLQNGFLDINQVLEKFKLDVKSDVKVDVKGEGQFTVQTLAEGLSSGQINVDTAIQAIKGLVEQGATIDLKQQANETTDSYVTGLNQNQIKVFNAGQSLGGAANVGMDIVDGTTPGEKGGYQFYSTIESKLEQAKAAGQSNAAGANSGFATVDGASQGSQGGDAFVNNVLARSGASQAAGQSNAAGANSGFATVDGGSQGGQGGDAFVNSVLARSGLSQAAGQSNASGANTGFNTINGRDPGTKGGTEFATSLSNQSGNAQSAGNKVANAGKDGLGSVKTYSIGESFVSGFVSGIKNGDGLAASAARGLANIALNAMRGELKVNSPSKRVRDEAGHPVGEGFEVGINEKIGAVKNAAQRMAQASIPKVNPSDISRATSYLRSSTSNVSAGDSYQSSNSPSSRKGSSFGSIPMQRSTPVQLVVNDQILGEAAVPWVDLAQGQKINTTLFFSGAR